VTNSYLKNATIYFLKIVAIGVQVILLRIYARGEINK
jgi:hypothetical protein